VEGREANAPASMTQTLLSAWTAARSRLEAAGVDSPAIDARLLLEAAADVARAEIIADPYRRLSEAQRARLAD
jgi:release factor glutamine methyltransferase